MVTLGLYEASAIAKGFGIGARGVSVPRLDVEIKL